VPNHSLKIRVEIDNDANSELCDGWTYGYTFPNDGNWDIWVCPLACRHGRWCLGATIIHELFHECHQDNPWDEEKAKGAEKACGFIDVCL